MADVYANVRIDSGVTHLSGHRPINASYRPSLSYTVFIIAMVSQAALFYPHPIKQPITFTTGPY